MVAQPSLNLRFCFINRANRRTLSKGLWVQELWISRICNLHQFELTNHGYPIFAFCLGKCSFISSDPASVLLNSKLYLQQSARSILAKPLGYYIVINPTLNICHFPDRSTTACTVKSIQDLNFRLGIQSKVQF